VTFSAVSRSRGDAWRSAAVLWALFFTICCGLGYATLNRYDPTRARSLYDTRDYARLVVDNPGPGERTHRAYRVGVPFLARPVHQLAEGRVGTWNPVFLALLAVNAALVAAAAAVLAGMAARMGLEHPTGVLAGLLLLANHTVVNAHLVGLVDSGELCAAVLLAAALRDQRWWALVPIGVGGALAKETFVAFGAVMAAVWWWMEWRRSPHALRAALWIALMAAASLGAVLLVRLLATGAVVGPVEIAQTLNRPAAGVLVRFRSLLLDPDFWYGLVWLLPLGLWSIGRVPRVWVASAFAAAGVALAMGGYAMAGGANVARPMFNVAGPPLCLAAAITLMRQPWLRGSAPASASTG
jgi:hypothetical protein